MTSGRIWEAKYYTTIQRVDGVPDIPVDMYIIRVDKDGFHITLGIDKKYDTKSLAEWICSVLNKEEDNS
jgi:hypothetical protein